MEIQCGKTTLNSESVVLAVGLHKIFSGGSSAKQDFNKTLLVVIFAQKQAEVSFVRNYGNLNQWMDSNRCNIGDFGNWGRCDRNYNSPALGAQHPLHHPDH